MDTKPLTGPRAHRLLGAYQTMEREGYAPPVPPEVLAEWRRVLDAYALEVREDLRREIEELSRTP